MGFASDPTEQRRLYLLREDDTPVPLLDVNPLSPLPAMETEHSTFDTRKKFDKYHYSPEPSSKFVNSPHASVYSK